MPWSEERMMSDIRAAMEASKISYRTLSKSANIPEEYLRSFVRTGRWGGLRFPEDLRNICKALQLSADDLLGLQEV